MVGASYSAVPEGKVADPPPPLPLLRQLMAEIHRLPLDTAACPPQKIPWPMVAIRNYQDNDSSSNYPTVFPPINHENLQIYTEKPPISQKLPHIDADSRQLSFSDSDSHSDSDSSSSSAFSPSYSIPSPLSPSLDFSNPASTRAANSPGWFYSWMKILCAKLKGIVWIIRSTLFTSSRGALLTFRSAAFSAFLFAFLYFRHRRREESNSRLIGIIKETDEKINHLLDQISGMNQVLLAFHYRSSNPNSSSQ